MPDLTELRDELARVCGWQCVQWDEIGEDGEMFGVVQWVHEHGAARVAESFHPFPPNDLNAIHTAIPKDANYTLSRTADGICELRSGWPVPYEGEPVTSEYEAIGRWLLAVLKEKAHA